MGCAYKIMGSPVGQLKLVASDDGLAAVLWENDDPHRVKLGELSERVDHPLLLQAEAELTEYFNGKRTAFSVPLDLVGTDFQKKVWGALQGIPFGETQTYADLAKIIGSPKASRAVGAAIGKNPVSIITPCHRAIGSDGSLTGFAGGLDAKRFLLALEGYRFLI
ncbi:methylated-DNA-[protein]-cysteine S-methyltransferase [Filomicrobium insigne]|uniref:Methylated-DNA--protein-cysteine methyltransferase n=1 Tax=Filomicrobium insigne TaxID=418854 RepID=A0A1H0HN26_9HYPH|nr:methylated-DNA--[protein]-cysteine S-methyltransferase [Filomicrobium insigne]SDO20618.1 methylated-DNA-[protein]-cysteine S-methyltransferase [Filomicrobium insigne]